MNDKKMIAALVQQNCEYHYSMGMIDTIREFMKEDRIDNEKVMELLSDLLDIYNDSKARFEMHMENVE